jgi:hypothetical protein
MKREDIKERLEKTNEVLRSALQYAPIKDDELVHKICDELELNDKIIESLNEEKEVNIVSDDLRKQISDLVVIAVADSNKLTEVIDKIVELKK